MPSIDTKLRDTVRKQVNRFLDSGIFNEEQIIAHIVKEYPVSDVLIKKQIYLLINGNIVYKDEEGVLKWR